MVAVVPAAGVGKRMQANCPKQYLKIGELTVLEHTCLRLLTCKQINKVIIALSAEDEYFASSQLAQHSQIDVVIGGQERVDSVLAGLQAIDSKSYPWVLVHDAARPCFSLTDLNKLITSCLKTQVGGILATPVKDTIKRSAGGNISHTVARENLWHALTPQMFPVELLKSAIIKAQLAGVNITDEASAIEFINEQSLLVEGAGSNIKITRPDDLALAEFILNSI